MLSAYVKSIISANGGCTYLEQQIAVHKKRIIMINDVKKVSQQEIPDFLSHKYAHWYIRTYVRLYLI
jgi:hypothetical protein